jgi:hypothetical protein
MPPDDPEEATMPLRTTTAAILCSILGAQGVIAVDAAASPPSRAALQPPRVVASAPLFASWHTRLADPWSSGFPARAALPAQGGWSLEDSRNVLLPDGRLAAVSCSDASACVAAGGYQDAVGVTVALVERWDGNAWRLQHAPVPPMAISTTMASVWCSSAASCIAVGYFEMPSGTFAPLGETWDGAAWTIRPVPAPPTSGSSGLFSVSCVSAAACTAVGDYNDTSGAPRPWAASWDGQRWHVEQAMTPPQATVAGLFGVACTGLTRCMAAGAYQDASNTTHTLAEMWNGSGWTVDATPDPAGFQGSGFAAVSCANGTQCVAVGSSVSGAGGASPLAERWSGSSWRIQVTPTPTGSVSAEFSGVSCTGLAACAVAGSFIGGSGATRGSGSMTMLPLAERWNGARWQVDTTPAPAASAATGFTSISCVAQSCIAVGASETAAARLLTLVEHSASAKWNIEQSPTPDGAALADNLLAVACPSPDLCIAVGYYSPSARLDRTLAERWDGTAWTIMTMPNASATTSSELHAVSCTSQQACTAVGGSGSSALVEAWDGQRWTVVPSPRPPAGNSYSLAGVSCATPAACIAVGSEANGAGAQHALSEAWNGTDWRVLQTPRPAGASQSALRAVSCDTAASCTAVGSANQALVEAWNGSRWRIETLATPPGAQATALFGVSCSTTRVCMAVGFASYTQGILPLAERWDGSTWSSVHMPLPASTANGTDPAAVACTTPSSCTAVGNYFQPNEHSTAFAEVWDGARWHNQATPTPAGSVLSALYGVSCNSGCTGAGFSTGVSNLQVTLAVGRNAP